MAFLSDFEFNFNIFQITRLENVLKSDEAKDMLGEALDPSASDFGAGLLDMLSAAPAVLDSGNKFSSSLCKTYRAKRKIIYWKLLYLDLL